MVFALMGSVLAGLIEVVSSCRMIGGHPPKDMAAEGEEASKSSQFPYFTKQRRTDGGPCRIVKKRKVLLSHSGEEKGFVSHLWRRLISVHHNAFFDVYEDCIPLGDEFAQIILEVCKHCKVAIVVLSDNYLKSKWPMLELASLVKAKNGFNPEMKILPLFYRLTVEQLKDPKRQEVWFKAWEKLKESDERLDISSWKNALRVLCGHNGAEYCGTEETEDEYVGSIVESVFKSVSPDCLYDDSHIKGGIHLSEAINNMFEKSMESREAGSVQCAVIGIYGPGGIGKSNLCEIAYNMFVGDFFGRACVIEIRSKSKSPLESQREVLGDLTGADNLLLNLIRHPRQGQRIYKERVGINKVFLAIDNVSDDRDSIEEADAYLVHELHPESKVLVTARYKKTLTCLGINEECCFEMPRLSEEDAVELFLDNAYPSLSRIEFANPEHLEVVKQFILWAWYEKHGNTEMPPELLFNPFELKDLGLLVKTGCESEFVTGNR